MRTRAAPPRSRGTRRWRRARWRRHADRSARPRRPPRRAPTCRRASRLVSASASPPRRSRGPSCPGRRRRASAWPRRPPGTRRGRWRPARRRPNQAIPRCRGRACLQGRHIALLQRRDECAHGVFRRLERAVRFRFPGTARREGKAKHDDGDAKPRRTQSLRCVHVVLLPAFSAASLPPPPLLRAPCGMLCLPRWLAAFCDLPLPAGETAVPRLPPEDAGRVVCIGLADAGRSAALRPGRRLHVGLGVAAVALARGWLLHVAGLRFRLLNVACRRRCPVGLGAGIAALDLRRGLRHVARPSLRRGRLRVAGLCVRRCAPAASCLLAALRRPA